jgi:hypothetical protein
MTFEGTRVSTNDFRFSLLSNIFSQTEDPIEDALDQLIEVMVLRERAEAAGIVLTDEEQENMLDWARSFKNMYANNGIDASFITDNRLAEILSTELYFEKLMDIYAADFVIDEEDFNREFADFKENNKMDYYDIQVKYAYSESLDDLTDARAEVEAGNMTFDELVERYHIGFDPEEGVTTTDLWQLFLEDEDNQAILALEEGDMSEVFMQLLPMEQVDHLMMYSVLVQLVSKTVPPEEEIADPFREHYTAQKRAEYFRSIIDTWKTEADFTINQRALDAI